MVPVAVGGALILLLALLGLVSWRWLLRRGGSLPAGNMSATAPGFDNVLFNEVGAQMGPGARTMKSVHGPKALRLLFLAGPCLPPRSTQHRPVPQHIGADSPSSHPHPYSRHNKHSAPFCVLLHVLPKWLISVAPGTVNKQAKQMGPPRSAPPTAQRLGGPARLSRGSWSGNSHSGSPGPSLLLKTLQTIPAP